MHAVASQVRYAQAESKTLRGASAGLSVQMQLRWRTGLHHIIAQGPMIGQTQTAPIRRAVAGCLELLTFISSRPWPRPFWTTSGEPRPPAVTT